jgi:hypothetical protein
MRIIVNILTLNHKFKTHSTPTRATALLDVVDLEEGDPRIAGCA